MGMRDLGDEGGRIMIYILGVTHDFQCYKEPVRQKITEFMEKIREICAEHDITAIIEEYNEDAIRNYGCDDSVCRLLSEELDIEHHYCDPDINAREDLGITNKFELERNAFFNNLAKEETDALIERQFYIREEYWINIIEENADHDNDYLFVCGNDHVDSIEQKLTGIGYEVEILQSKFITS